MVKIPYDKFKNKFCGVNNFTSKLSRLLESKQKLSETNYSVFNVHYPVLGAKFSLSLLLQAFLCKLRGIKIVLTLHEYAGSGFLRKLSARPLIFLADGIVFTNNKEKEFLNTKNRKVALIPIFSNVGLNVVNNRESFKSKDIVFFGNFYPARKVHEIIDAFKNSKAHENFRLILCGSPNARHMNYYNQMLEKIKGDDHIVLHNNVSNEYLQKILDQSFCGIGLYDEGLSEKRTSAMAFLSIGLPFISNPAVSNPYFIPNVNFCALETLDQALGYLGHSENYCRVADNGLKLYRDCFSEEVIVSQYIGFFEKVLNERIS